MRRAGRGGVRAAVAALALTVATGASAAGAAPEPDLRRAQAATKAAMDADGFFLKDGAGPAAALERQWGAARLWAADWLRLHPGASAASAAAALKAASGFDVSAERLDARSLLVAVTDGALGNAFVLRRGDDGRVATAWAVEAPGAAQAAAFPLLEAWSPARAGDRCRDRRAQAQAARCGPLTAEVALLRPEAGGARRFVLHGVYAQEAGATGGQLVSVWRWDGRAAEPLLAREFIFTADQVQPLVDVRGGGLTIGSKESWRQLFACGACEGRQARTEALLPARGAALGPTVSLTPELDAVDSLYDAATRDRATGGFAGTSVGAVARHQMAQAPASPGAGEGAGMVMAWRTAGGPERRDLCLETDVLGAQRFGLVRDGGAWRVATVAPARAGACDGPGSRS